MSLQNVIVAAVEATILNLILMKLCVSLEIDKTVVKFEFWSICPSVRLFINSCCGQDRDYSFHFIFTKLSVSIGIDKTALKIEFGDFLMNSF